jgi:antitoxin component YwqK of YwqJK toxin-antitoxin module
MKKTLLNILFLFIINSLFSQNCVTEEIKAEYSNGLEIFNICKNNPKINFNNELDYYWYTEFSKIKITKGGSGGKLLSGDYKFFDKNGNLIENKQFKNGVQHGESKIWDNKGNLLEISRHSDGISEYWKHREDSGSGWVEHIGQILTNGWIKNSYDEYNQLEASEVAFGTDSDIQNLKKNVTTYYLENGNKKQVYTSRIGSKLLLGDYKKFHKNGKVEIEGSFYDGKFYSSSVRNCTWKWYNESGILISTEEYKVQISYWENGNAKSLGSLFYNNSSDKWLKNGNWYYYDENGELEDKRVFELDIERDN